MVTPAQTRNGGVTLPREGTPILADIYLIWIPEAMRMLPFKTQQRLSIYIRSQCPWQLAQSMIKTTQLDHTMTWVGRDLKNHLVPAPKGLF